MLDPLSFEFFRHGLLAATMVGALCGMIGVYVVLRRMSYIGHGLSHSVFGGAVVSYVINWNFYLGAGLWGFISALLINATTHKRKIGADAAIGIITTASFALGVAIVSRERTFTRNFDAALFGNILGVTEEDLFVIAGVLVFTAVVIFLRYKQFLFATFDPEVAPVYGVPLARVDALFSLVLAATIVASMNIVGVTLIAAAIVIPPICARLVTDSFRLMLGISTGLGAVAGFAGMYLSYYIDIASGASIVLFAAGLFLLALAWSTIRARLPVGRAERDAAEARVGDARALFD
jgi:manganese/iron transport system permease protein/iron/zinc/copper transport system permease protein